MGRRYVEPDFRAAFSNAVRCANSDQDRFYIQMIVGKRVPEFRQSGSFELFKI